jgi:hypothetical protein
MSSRLCAERLRGGAESRTAPQVGGNPDWVRLLRLPQEHG